MFMSSSHAAALDVVVAAAAIKAIATALGIALVTVLVGVAFTSGGDCATRAVALVSMAVLSSATC